MENKIISRLRKVAEGKAGRDCPKCGNVYPYFMKECPKCKTKAPAKKR